MGGQRIILFQPSDSRKLLAYQYQTAAREQNELGAGNPFRFFFLFLPPRAKRLLVSFKKKDTKASIMSSTNATRGNTLLRETTGQEREREDGLIHWAESYIAYITCRVEHSVGSASASKVARTNRGD